MKPTYTGYNQKGAAVKGDKQVLVFNFLRILKDKLGFLLVFKFRLVPMVIFFAVLVLGTRVTTFVTHMGQGNFLKQAHAKAVSQEKNGIIGKLDKLPSKKGNDLKAIDDFDPFNMTSEQYRALKGVVEERSQLSNRERSISEKEQVLQALIEKMDEKVAELKLAKSELENLIGKIDEEESANTKRLVKITEAMKPPEAARRLETIEFPIILEIIEKMKEKKASAILAVMEPDKAGYLMTALSKRRKIFRKDNPKKSIMKG